MSFSVAAASTKTEQPISPMPASSSSGSKRKRPANERASGSSKGWTELPKLAVSISGCTLATTPLTSPRRRRLSRDDRHGHAGRTRIRVRHRPLVLHAEQRRQDLACLGSGGVGAEAAVLGGHDHDVAE